MMKDPRKGPLYEQFAQDLALAGLGPVGRKASDNRPNARRLLR